MYRSWRGVSKSANNTGADAQDLLPPMFLWLEIIAVAKHQPYFQLGGLLLSNCSRIYKLEFIF